jgi:hypothetical protein
VVQMLVVLPRTAPQHSHVLLQIMAGEEIDATFGVSLGLSTMAAAGQCAACWPTYSHSDLHVGSLPAARQP